MDPRFNAIVGLYQAMPGAPMPPKEDGVTLWGVVGGNQHWTFCEAIIDFVEDTVRHAQITPEDERNTGFFTQLLNEANFLSPGESFVLYGPKSVTTHPDYARLHSMLNLHIFGEPEPGQADRWKFTVIKGKAVASEPTFPEQYEAFIKQAEVAIPLICGGKIEHIHGPYGIVKTQRWADFLRDSCVHCEVQQHGNDPAWARFSFRTIF